MKVNTWEKVVSYFNIKLALGNRRAEVRRVDFINDWMFKKDSIGVIETYRLYLTRAGYLNHMGRGIYHVVKPIPAQLTSKACYRKAYNK